MAEFPALPLFTDAYLGDTRHLNAAQHGAYLLLLMMAWRQPDCAIPDDDKILARWTSMDNRTWKANRDVVLSFWILGENGKFTQDRLLDERKYVEHLRSKNSAAGKSSALKRLNRGSTTVPTKPQPLSNPYTHTHTTTLTNVRDMAIPEEFSSTFWPAYPTNGRQKGNKKNAEKSFSKARAKTPLELIMEGLKNYAAYLEESGEYNADAATWINRHGWEDDYQSTRAKGKHRNGGSYSPQDAINLARADQTGKPTSGKELDDLIGLTSGER